MTNLEPQAEQSEFERLAAEQDPGFVRELMQFLAEEKKWWLLPIVVVLLMLGLVLLVGGTSLAPFLYTLF